jgi:hypothetical protein
VSKIITLAGIALLVIAAGALLLTARDLVVCLRFGGPGGSFIGQASFAQMIVDGAIALLSGAGGVVLTWQHLKRPQPRRGLIAAAVVAVLLGVYAGSVS